MSQHRPPLPTQGALVAIHDMSQVHTQHAVVIAGAGPTRLMLAAELALAGVDAAIVERRPSQELDGLRARGLHSRTLEVLDQRGIVDRFLALGKRYPIVHFHVALDISDFPTRHNYVLGLQQSHIERILADRVRELAVPVYRGTAVTGFTQYEDGVDVQLSGGRCLRAEFLVGCDGGRSLVRKVAGIGFPGSDASMSWLIAEVQTSEEPEWGFRHDAIGTHAIAKLADPQRTGIVLTERQLRSGDQPALEEFREALIGVYGTDYGIHSPTSLYRFTDMARQAAAYRRGRVLLAGDAAHVHSPMGGQGLNTGVQDAVNLGWKLAQVVKGISPLSLLDTYHAERHPVAARVLSNTMAHAALRRTDERTKALGGYLAELLSMEEPRRRMAGEMSGPDIHYDLGPEHSPAHPLVGRRVPDLDLITADGPLRVFALLKEARPVLLNLGEPGSLDTALEGTAWAKRVMSVCASYDSPWELPVIGAVEPPGALFIRPDGHVAWAGDASHASLADALTTWAGSSAAT